MKQVEKIDTGDRSTGKASGTVKIKYGSQRKNKVQKIEDFKSVWGWGLGV